MHDYAAHFAFGPGRVIIEPVAPEQLVRAMLEELDRRDPAAAVMHRVEQVAQSWGLDPVWVFDADSPRTQLLWQAMQEIEGHGGGHLIVPSRVHLTGLGPSGSAVIERLTRMPRAHIYVLDTPSPADRTGAQQPQPGSPEMLGRGERVLVESAVGAIPTLTRFDMVAELTRRGWPQVMEAVDALYMALVDDADAAAEAAGELGFGPGGKNGVIRLLQRDDGLLVVELEETGSRQDAPAAALTTLCAHTQRFTDHGRTITRCTLPRHYAPPVVAVPDACTGRRP
jgi:hypothetical protein